MISRNMRKNCSVALIVATCLLCLTRTSLCDVSTENNNNNNNNSDKTSDKTQEPKKAQENESPKSDVAESIDNKHNDRGPEAAPVPAGDEKNENTSGGPKLTSDVHPAAVKVNNDAADTEKTPKAPEPPTIGHAASLNSGALLRGFYVFVGLSVLAVAYIVFRSFRLNKSRTQMVRKYGVLAHKQDIEMRPLPLDEDDEDDTTVFDARGLSPPPRLES